MQLKATLALAAFGLLALHGCNSNGSNNVTPATGFYRNIPNWYDGDTLKGFIIDSMGNGVGTQSIYTKRSGDTSLINYLGKRYYIFQYKANALTDGSDGPEMVGPICISTTPSTSGSVINLQYMTMAQPHKFRLQNGTWQHQLQALIVGDRTFFPNVQLNTYVSENVK